MLARSRVVNHEIFSPRCWGWGKQNAGVCWRSGRCTELCKFAEFQSYEFLEFKRFLKRRWAKIHSPVWTLSPRVPALGREDGASWGSPPHHAPTGAVWEERFGSFSACSLPESPADSSWDSRSLALTAHDPGQETGAPPRSRTRSCSPGPVLCGAREARSTQYCRAYKKQQHANKTWAQDKIQRLSSKFGYVSLPNICNKSIITCETES